MDHIIKMAHSKVRLSNFFFKRKNKDLILKQQVAVAITLVGLETVGVTMRQTMRAAILMAVTVVDQTLIRNIARNAYVLKI